MTYIKINGQEYPFKFGQRELQTISQNFADLASNGEQDDKQIEYDKIGQRMASSFDLFLQAFHTACKKGCRLHKREHGKEIIPLNVMQIEDAIDDNPELYEELFDAFNNSQTVKHFEEVDDKKKPKS